MGSREEYIKSITWSTEDFITRAQELAQLEEEEIGWEELYDETKFADALDEMINDHDANYGISWSTIDYYLNTYCKK